MRNSKLYTMASMKLCAAMKLLAWPPITVLALNDVTLFHSANASI